MIEEEIQGDEINHLIVTDQYVAVDTPEGVHRVLLSKYAWIELYLVVREVLAENEWEVDTDDYDR